MLKAMNPHLNMPASASGEPPAPARAHTGYYGPVAKYFFAKRTPGPAPSAANIGAPNLPFFHPLRHLIVQTIPYS